LKTKATQFCSTQTRGEISAEDISKLNWLLPTLIKLKIRVNGFFVGPSRDGNPGVPMPLKLPKTWQFQESSIEEFHNSTADEEGFD
jgi:hypothetical protein